MFGSALVEAVAEVGRAKEQIVKFIETGAAVDLDGIDLRFEAVRGALDLLDQHDASALLKGAQRYVADNIVPDQPLPGAEALDSAGRRDHQHRVLPGVAVEGRFAAERILEVAESSLDRLGYRVPAATQAAPAAQIAVEAATSPPSRPKPASASSTCRTSASMRRRSRETHSAAELPRWRSSPPGRQRTRSAPVESIVPAEPVAPVAPAPAPVVIGRRNGRMNYDAAVLGTDLDDEILEIFLEEADEVLETIRVEYPKWRNNSDNQGALVTCRRMFHTLKGSGRLAGALRLGELAWSIENLLNRVLDNTIQPDAANARDHRRGGGAAAGHDRAGARWPRAGRRRCSTSSTAPSC